MSAAFDFLVKVMAGYMWQSAGLSQLAPGKDSKQKLLPNHSVSRNGYKALIHSLHSYTTIRSPHQ